MASPAVRAAPRWSPGVGTSPARCMAAASPPGARFRALRRHYTILETLSEGGNSTVYRAVRCGTTDASDVLGEEVAIKVVAKSGMSDGARVALAREVLVLRNLATDANSLRYIEVLEDAQYVYVVMELLVGGDLLSALTHRCDAFSPADALRVVRDVFSSLSALHDRGIAHRDVKLENVMFADADHSVVKLIDFGLCHRRRPGGDLHARQPCGTAAYSPPQIVLRAPYVPEEGDSWSVGVVLYALLCRRLPFGSACPADGGVAMEALGRRIVEASPTLHGGVWDRVPFAVKDLLSALLSKDGADRPSAREAIEMIDEILAGLDQGAGEEEEEVTHEAFDFLAGAQAFVQSLTGSRRGSSSRSTDSGRRGSR